MTDNFYDQVEELIAHGRAHDVRIGLVGFADEPGRLARGRRFLA